LPHSIGISNDHMIFILFFHLFATMKE